MIASIKTPPADSKISNESAWEIMRSRNLSAASSSDSASTRQVNVPPLLSTVKASDSSSALTNEKCTTYSIGSLHMVVVCRRERYHRDSYRWYHSAMRVYEYVFPRRTLL